MPEPKKISRLFRWVYLLEDAVFGMFLALLVYVVVMYSLGWRWEITEIDPQPTPTIVYQAG